MPRRTRGNNKSEIRNPKQIQSKKSEISKPVSVIPYSYFEFVSDLGI